MRELVGQKFSRWTVISYSHKKGPHHFWRCRCNCGTQRVIQEGSIVKGRTRSCGCLRREIARKVNFIHGMSHTLLYMVWERMWQRCSNPNAKNYKYYGGRGIKVCERWKSFENFFGDIGYKWKQGLSIDRKNRDGDYEPSNCRWATKREQATNRSSTVMIDTKWGMISVSELARRTGINRRTLAYRISKSKET